MACFYELARLRLPKHPQDAQAQFENLWTRQRAVLGSEHPDTLASLHGLACSYWKMEKYAQAERLLEDVISGKTKALGEDHPETKNAVSCLLSVRLETELVKLNTDS